MLSVSRIIVIGVLCLGLSVPLAAAVDNITVECYPNGTITMENPKPTFFTNGVANDSAAICSLAYSGDNSLIYITNCNLGDVILVSLTNRSTLDVIMGGLGSTLYTIQCNDVGTEGVNKSVTHPFLPSVAFTSKAPQTYFSYAEMVFREDNTSGSEITSTTVGQRITWSIETAAEHYLSILNCTAYGGQTTTSADNVALIVNGCSQDKSLVGTDFETNNYDIVGGEKRYYADFFVFKFMDNDFLTVGCTVKICPLNDTSCDMSSCPGSGRRRREAVEVPDSVLTEYQRASATLRIVDALSGTDKPKISYYFPWMCILAFTLLPW